MMYELRSTGLFTGLYLAWLDQHLDWCTVTDDGRCFFESTDIANVVSLLEQLYVRVRIDGDIVFVENLGHFTYLELFNEIS